MDKNQITQTDEKKVPEKKKSILKSGIMLSLMTLASRIMGLVRERTRARFLGTSMIADAFSTSFMIPNLLRRLFAENSVSAAFIPTFKEYLKSDETAENRKKTQEFISATFTFLTFVTALVVVLGILISPLITKIFCPIPDADAANYAELYKLYLLKSAEITDLTKIMFPYLFFISIAALFQGILNGCGIYAPSGFTPVLFNSIVIIGTYVLAPYTKDPAFAMSIGVVAGGSVQAIFQWPFIRKTGWKICFTTIKKAFQNPGTKKVLKLVAPTIIGMAAYQLNDIVSTRLANITGEGIASSLQYSLRLQELVLGIFAVSIGTVILPDFSSYAVEKKWDEFNKLFLNAVKIMTLIAIPVTFYSIVNGKELISLLYKKDSFDEASVLLTFGEFKYHMAGLLFIALNRIIAPAFYAQKRPKLPTLAGIYSFIANIIFAIILSKFMQGNGIALALSASSLINTIFLFIYTKKMESLETRRLVKGTIFYALKMIIFSVIAAAPCYFLRPILVDYFAGHNAFISYGCPAIVSLVIFLVIGVLELLITKDEIAILAIQKVTRRKTGK